MATADQSAAIALLRSFKDQEEDPQAEDLVKVIYAQPVADASKRRGLGERAMLYAAAMKDGGVDRVDDLLLLTMEFYENRVGMRFADAAQWMQVVSSALQLATAVDASDEDDEEVTLKPRQKGLPVPSPTESDPERTESEREGIAPVRAPLAQLARWMVRRLQRCWRVWPRRSVGR